MKSNLLAILLLGCVTPISNPDLGADLSHRPQKDLSVAGPDLEAPDLATFDLNTSDLDFSFLVICPPELLCCEDWFLNTFAAKRCAAIAKEPRLVSYGQSCVYLGIAGHFEASYVCI